MNDDGTRKRAFWIWIVVLAVMVAVFFVLDAVRPARSFRIEGRAVELSVSLHTGETLWVANPHDSTHWGLVGLEGRAVGVLCDSHVAQTADTTATGDRLVTVLRYGRLLQSPVAAPLPADTWVQLSKTHAVFGKIDGARIAVYSDAPASDTALHFPVAMRVAGECAVCIRADTNSAATPHVVLCGRAGSISYADSSQGDNRSVYKSGVEMIPTWLERSHSTGLAYVAAIGLLLCLTQLAKFLLDVRRGGKG